MKKLLIFVNVILVFLLALSLWGAFAGGNVVAVVCLFAVERFA